jgi:hypothetical protein
MWLNSHDRKWLIFKRPLTDVSAYTKYQLLSPVNSTIVTEFYIYEPAIFPTVLCLKVMTNIIDSFGQFQYLFLL